MLSVEHVHSAERILIKFSMELLLSWFIFI